MRYLLALVLLLTLSGICEAKRYTAVKDGKEVIVHTRRAPVMLHRMVPPNLGKHVWEGELK